MSASTRYLVTGAIATAVVGVPAAASASASASWASVPSAPCDAYSGHCPNVEPRQIHRPPAEVLPTRVTLPFTGAELVGMTTAGVLAIGAGTVFVVTHRRRRV
jgi:hypothetical protein